MVAQVVDTTALVMPAKNQIEEFRRYEFKYIVRNSTAELIHQDVSEFLEPDPFLKQTSQESYLVRSLYFDNSASDYFYEKIDGLKTRRKYRLRTYSSNFLDAQMFFLEEKGKKNERTYKNRKWFDIADLDRFLADDSINWLIEEQSGDEFIDQYIYDSVRRQLRPTVVVEYQRRPLISNHDSYFRITFDSDLLSFPSNGLFLENERHIKCLPGYTIIELKFLRRIPLWFHRIIQSRELRRVSVSKFVVGMKAGELAADLS